MNAKQERVNALIKMIEGAMQELGELAKEPGVEDVFFHSPDRHVFVRCFEKDHVEEWNKFMPEMQTEIGRWIASECEMGF